jgi:ribosomal protein L24E
VINRRMEVRVEDCHSCEYEIIEPGEPRVAVVQQGQVFTLNRSAHGMLLLMGHAPRPSQLIEVHSARLGWWRSTMVYDVRWTRSIQIGPQGSLFLVGCRLTTGLPL